MRKMFAMVGILAFLLVIGVSQVSVHFGGGSEIPAPLVPFGGDNGS